YAQRLVHAQRSAVLDPIGQGLTFEQLHGEVEPARVLYVPDVCDIDDVGMAEPADGLRFEQEPRAGFGAGLGRQARELDREVAPEHLVARGPHAPHRARANGAEKAVASSDEV